MANQPNPATQSNQESAEDNTTSSSSLSFPIVCLGASAGGLEALKNFLTAMPADSGLAFVVVQHLDPTHESMMVDLLGRYTAMPVRQSEDGMDVEPNCVYMIPPKWYLRIVDRKLRLTEPTERRGMRMSIDVFLKSLAEDQQQHAIGVILSGTGSDGSAGIKEIKTQGGMVMAQDPATASHDGMPRSAINTGLVDFILSVEQMPEALQKYAKHPYLNGKTAANLLLQPPGDDMNTVLALLRARQGYDFRCYKPTMLTRRLERRMGLNHLEKIADYVNLLRDSPAELEQLSRDLLIGVSGFFRDPEVFNELENRVIRPLVAQADHNATLRVWVAGCSTGEEAYTLAMLFFDAMAAQDKYLGLQIFASDIDKEALETARAGLYPTGIATDINPERLKRYFVLTENDRYEVSKELREIVVFAQQNLVSDPPFSKLDLVSCRNLLIYLQPQTQDRLIALFHFALKQDGYLLLGSSESIGRHDDLFVPLSKPARIYQRIVNVAPQPVDFPLVSQQRYSFSDTTTPPGAPKRRPPRFEELAKGWLLDEFVPAAVLINRRHEVLYFHGSVVDYLDIPSGKPNHNLLEMLREGLSTQVRNAIHRAFQDNRPVILERVRVRRNGGYQPVSIQIKPTRDPTKNNNVLLIAFRNVVAAKETITPKEETSQTDKIVIRQLEDELNGAKEDLQSTVEAMETSTEELKASNEEVMSINEELQSSNEELETSKEELQSLNEELITINNQLQDKVSELEDANNDMENLLASTEMATVFLDTSLRIKRFTPATTELFNLIPSDRGRPLTDIAQKFTDPDLIADAERVLNHLAPLERHVHDGSGRWFRRRVLPYRTRDNRIDGLVVTFVDVTQLRTSEKAARQRLMEIEGVYKHAPIGLCVLDRELRYLRINKRLAEINGRSVRDHLGKTVREILPKLADQAEPLLRRIIDTGEPALNVEISGETQAKPGVIRHWLEHWYPLRGEDGKVRGINIVAEEITARKQQEKYQLVEKAVAQQLVSGVSFTEAIPKVIEAFSKGFETAICEIWMPEPGNTTLSCTGFFVPGADEKTKKAIKALFDETTFAAGDSLIGRVWAERKPRWIEELAKEPLFQRVDEAAQLGLRTGFAFPLLADGEILGVMSFFCRQPLAADELLLAMMTKLGRDLGEYILRIRAEAALKDSEQRFRTIVQGAPIPIMLHTLDGDILLLNDAFTKLTGYTHDDIPDGKTWLQKAYDLSAAEAAQRHRDIEQRSKSSSIPTEKELRIRTKHGTQQHWLFKGSPLFQLADGRRYMVSMAVDISARKKAEQRLRELAQQLEAADRRKNEFLSVLGHELRNPLAAISNGLELLQRDASMTPLALPMMADNLNTMRRLLDDLLDLNRVSRGKIDLKREPVELGKILNRVITTVKPLLEQKQQSLITDLPEQPLVVDADAVRIEQVFSNLLTNASKYTGNGGCIEVHAGCREATDRVIVEISDTGCGIPEEWLARIFEPFIQIANEEAPNSGLGIGLALVKQLVALHDGTISAFSEGKGRGSRFEVALPRIDGGTGRQDTPVAAEEPNALTPGLRVLLVDDNPANLTTLSMILEAWGCQVATATDGANALRVAKDFQPQVMILDIGLPDMDGYELIQRLRKDGFSRALAIAISGYGHEQAKAAAKSASFDHHLTKPADLNELHRLLAQVPPD